MALKRSLGSRKKVLMPWDRKRVWEPEKNYFTLTPFISIYFHLFLYRENTRKSISVAAWFLLYLDYKKKHSLAIYCLHG
jgi:hypothetical protein